MAVEKTNEASIADVINSDYLRLATVEEAVGVIPVSVIEHTMYSYRRNGDSTTCSLNGGINEERIQHLDTVHIFQRSHQTVSLYCDLDICPHYEESITHLDSFKRECSAKGVNAKALLSHWLSYSVSDQFMAIMNGWSGSGQCAWGELVRQLIAVKPAMPSFVALSPQMGGLVMSSLCLVDLRSWGIPPGS